MMHALQTLIFWKMVQHVKYRSARIKLLLKKLSLAKMAPLQEPSCNMET